MRDSLILTAISIRIKKEFKAREKNAGWRIDYFCTSKALESRLEDAKILTNVFGSDHCPVELDFK